MMIGRRIGRALEAAVFRLGLGPARLYRAALNAALRSAFYALTLRGRTPTSLTAPGTPPWFETTTDAATLKAGFLITGGRRIPFDGDPWATLPKNETVRAAAHGFGWLAALCDGVDGENRLLARRLLDDWIAANPRWSEDAWAVDVLADRLTAWAHWLPVLYSDEEDSEARRCAHQSFARQLRHLARTGGHGGPEDWRAFATCRGLIRTGLALPGEGPILPLGLRRLEAEITRQILPDGGHFQRCPSLQKSVLALLIDMRGALSATQHEVPAFLQAAIDRMAPMLRLFRLGDGGNEETRTAVERVLDDSQSKGRELINAPHTGFQRIVGGATIVIADTGTPPPPGAQTLAHAGPLAFEMSVGPHRIVVNCGAPALADPAWTAATRATAAHSTAGIDDTNAVEFLSGGRIGAAPSEVQSQRRESDEGETWLDCQHNGYVETLGSVHRRRFYMGGSGDDFRGEDVFTGDGGKTFRARFHLHPSIQASLIKGGTGVLLRLPGGAGWRFLATGGTVSLEDSIYLGAGAEPRRTEQIIVSGLLDGEETAIKWRFSKVGG